MRGLALSLPRSTANRALSAYSIENACYVLLRNGV
jgi:hypothetical protein